MAINYKNLTPSVYQSSYSSQQSRKPQTSSKSYPVMGTTAPKPVQPTTSPLATSNYAAMAKAMYPTAKPVVAAKPKVNTQLMSVAPRSSSVASAMPKVNPALQSGAGAQYGNNPLNQPAPVAKQQTMTDWLAKTNALYGKQDKFYNDSEARRLALARQQYTDTKALQDEMYNNAATDLRGELPVLEGQFNRFEQGVRANMAEADQIGAQQKANAETYTGDAQRTAMQNKRQTDAQREKQYAALGTIDSYGTGSFTQGNANADTEFNRQTAQRYDALAQNLTEIDRTVAGAKREALALIDQKRAEYDAEVRKINSLLRDNEVQRRAAIQQAYYSTQEAIGNIQDKYEELRLASEQQKLTFAQEMEKLTAENTMPNVSDWFKQTGQPQTQEDFNFIYKNPSAATAIQKMLNPTQGKTTEKGQAFKVAASSAQQALDALDSGMAGTGKGQVVSSWFGRQLGDQPQSQTDYEAKLAAARGIALSALSGANVPESEYKRLADMIPVLSDEPQIAKQKLASFIQVMNSYSNSMSQVDSALSQDQVASLLTEVQGM